MPLDNLNPLSREDHYRLTAASGWLELGNLTEANRELDAITPAFRVHPDALEVRWQIYAEQKMWIAAFEIATAICELDPERPSGWICQAYSLNESDRTQKACEVLQKVVENFPNLPIIPYSLACYTCRLGRPDQAWLWLEMAAARGNSRNVARLALQELDLKPLWSRLKAKLAVRKPVVRSAPARRSWRTAKKLLFAQHLQTAVRKKSGSRFRSIS